MIDPENEVYTRVAEMLRAEFPGISVASEYVKAPSAFPHVSIVQSDNYTLSERQDSSMTENMVVVMFEVNCNSIIVYTNFFFSIPIIAGVVFVCQHLVKIIYI